MGHPGAIGMRPWHQEGDPTYPPLLVLLINFSSLTNTKSPKTTPKKRKSGPNQDWQQVLFEGTVVCASYGIFIKYCNSSTRGYVREAD